MATENGQGFMPVADVALETPPGPRNYMRVRVLNLLGNGAVESVNGQTGDVLLDTDTLPNTSAVVGLTTTDALNELLAQQNLLRQRMHFFAGSIDDTTIGIDPNNPSFLSGMILDPGSFGISFNPTDGSAQNVTGRALPQVVGTISFQPDKLGGGTTLLHIWSERSSDGITYTANDFSLRAIEIANSGETFKTSLSAITNWLPDEYIRFRVYALSGGAITFSSPTDTVNNGEMISGYSVAWELGEN